MNPLEIISLILNLAFGGGFFFQLLSINSLKAKAKAEAKKAEAEATSYDIKNVQEAVKEWRELAEIFKADLIQAHCEKREIMSELENLRNEVVKLRTATNRVLKLLDKITPENLESTIDEIRKEINNRS